MRGQHCAAEYGHSHCTRFARCVTWTFSRIQFRVKAIYKEMCIRDRANIVALYAVMTSGFGDAMAVSLLRTLLGSLISGTFLSVGYYLSTAGAVLSTVVMYLSLIHI